MARSTAWKSFERWVASIFTSERNPLSGGNGKHSRSDSLHPELFISCKHTRTGHRSIFRLLDEETEKAEAENKIPIVILGRSGPGIGQRKLNTLAIIPVHYLKAFREADNIVIKDDLT